MRMTSLLAAAFLTGAVALAGDADAEARGSAYESVFGPCRGQTCVIRENPGGNVMRFLAAAAEINAGSRRVVVIDGLCASACAIFADVARERVCITDRAVVGFHKATLLRAERDGEDVRWRRVLQRDPQHSRDIAGWVKRNGGFPARGLNLMNASEGGQFWRRCELRQR